MSGGNSYQTVLLPANKLITEKTFQNLINLARNGADVLVYKNLPKDVPGLANLNERRKTFQQLIALLNFTNTGDVKKAIIGKGAFYVSDNMDKLLAAAKTRKEPLVKKNLQFIRRKTNEGQNYFINNRTDKAINDWVLLNTKATSIALYEPMIGKTGLARWRPSSEGIEVFFQLQPFESLIVQTYNSKKKTADQYPYSETNGEKKEVTGNWTIEFLTGGPALPKSITTSLLKSWTDFDGEKVKNFSGTARYSINFQKPVSAAGCWLLDLGKVNETAEVFLNGKKLETVIGPSFQLVIPSSELKASNRLEIIVANLMANRIAYMDRNNISWKIFYNTNMPARKRENTKNGLFDASGWKPLPSGLLGPVSLTPLK